MNAWRFRPNFDSVRKSQLIRFDTFASVIDALLSNLEIVGGWICEGNDLGPKGCWRPTASVIVSPEAFDAFFNSPVGYRAEYLASPERGQAANGTLLALLEPQLTAKTLTDCGKDRLSPEWIRNAYLANSSKIWIDETELDFTQATFDLDIETWKEKRDQPNAPSGAGLWAPQGTKLIVHGAFIDPWGNEVVARGKICRRFEIHGCGFT